MKTFEEYLRQTGEVGTVESIVQSVVYASGLPRVKPNELVITESGQKGWVQAISPNLVEILMVSGETILPNTRITRTGENFKIPLSEKLLGRVINPLGESLDGLGAVQGEITFEPIEKDAPGVMERVRITEPIETGVSLVDFMVPLGKGQRQLILGDAKVGKTTFLLQAASFQAKKGSLCVYVGIGKKKTDMKAIEDYFKRTGVFENCVMVFSSSADPAPLVYLTPFSGFSVAEFFRDLGREVLIILDDLTTHAKYYREISLLSKKMPARESYPGDIFHLHAKLLERAGRIKQKEGSISIAALPVVETVQGDLTGFMPTNAMAMTDGHLFFDAAEFKKGRRPAINVFLSVTRVGNQTQNILEQNMRKSLVEKLSFYRKAEELARFGFDLPLKTRSDLAQGAVLEAIFDQETYTTLPKTLSLLLASLAFIDFWSGKDIEQVRVERSKIAEAYHRGILQEITDEIDKMKYLETLQNFARQKTEAIKAALYSALPYHAEKAKTLKETSNV